MSGVALLDVNVLVALFDPDHVHHDLAHDWFADHRTGGWATCPLTEAGFVRVLSNPAYDGPRLRPAELIARLAKFCKSGHHHFWDQRLSLLDESVFDHVMLTGHRQVTDVYLLGLAKAHDGRLVSFDRSIPLRAVKGSTRAHLVIVAPASDPPS